MSRHYPEDLTDQVCNKLTVLGKVAGNTRRVYWNCLCECGEITTASTHSLVSKHKKSCGCLKRQKASDRAKAGLNHRHNCYHHPLYGTWNNMIQRCYNKKNKSYCDYGQRGIRVCPQWKASPEAFIADLLHLLGPKPSPEYSLDRVDNDSGYWPQNVRWATKEQQIRNRRGGLL